MNWPYFFVFDVESVGLHGRPFWVGFTVIDRFGKEHDSNSYHMGPIPVGRYEMEDYEWVKANVPVPPSNSVHCETRFEMEELFWKNWVRWRNQGAVMAAEVPWPVEANFLHNCMEHYGYKKQAPYPIIDIATYRFAKGKDPLATEIRLARELPVHNPLADARQSARLLLEVL